jgi:hypothetical protein
MFSLICARHSNTNTSIVIYIYIQNMFPIMGQYAETRGLGKEIKMIESK